MIIQNNIEYFTFVGFRAFDVPFSFTPTSTMVQAFTILFMFIVLLTAITSYLFYYYRYEKLARYFLSNMYRFKSSYVLMTITFGLRPFLKGLVHAKFFDNWNLQIWLLIGSSLLWLSSSFCLKLDLIITNLGWYCSLSCCIPSASLGWMSCCCASINILMRRMKPSLNLNCRSSSLSTSWSF